jgi:acetoacetyl-CoA synthetase
MALLHPSGTDCSIDLHPTPVTVELLTNICQSVLKRPAVRLDDDFFKIGGSVRLADLVFAEIAQKLGRELPSATIFHAPTIAALASVLDQAVLPRFSPFVQLKAGRQHPPILIAPGLDGRASFSGLAQLIRSEHPIYGIQAKGVDGLEYPLDSIEEMARFYLESLKDLQPEGPHILIGYSFGGLVALEMAQRLLKQRKQIALLVMIDAYPHLRYLSPAQRLQLGAQRAKRRILELKRRRIGEGLSYLREGIERRWHIAGVGTRSQASHLSLEQTTVRVKRKAYMALGRYRPRPHSDKIKFIKSETDTYFPGDPVPVWAHLAGAFEVETVRGSHLNMVTTHFEGLAAVLTRYVTEAAGRK